jgi:hypothetical protein
MLEASMSDHSRGAQTRAGYPDLLAGLILVALLAVPIATAATMAKSSPRADEAAADTYSLAAATMTVPSSSYRVLSDPPDIGHFAFGYLEFDWDPTAIGGVPGFDSWTPGSPRR